MFYTRFRTYGGGVYNSWGALLLDVTFLLELGGIVVSEDGF